MKILALILAALFASTHADDSSSSSSSSSGYSYSSKSSIGAYGYNFFADSQSTVYDGYQQAWRYLGWYVKCGAPSDRYDEGGGSQHSGSGDNGYVGNNWCQRYLIWAAYVDESYKGGGTGEYSYFDPYSQKWDETACSKHGNGRCALMDCHLSNTTTWKLMGVFKEASYFGNDAFFEQLFKHQGVCLWNDDDTYDFMSSSRKQSWTQGCVSTYIEGSSYYFDTNAYDYDGSNYLYLDLKPTWNGNMTYGLYTDSACKTEYEGLDVDVDTVAKNMGLLYGSYLRQWNDGLEVFKVCRPCKTSNLANAYKTSSYSENQDYDYYGNDPNNGYFQCDDDAGYTNVNQCMKFRTHAELEVATWEDLVTATNQGGILEVDVGGTVFGSERMSAEEWSYIQNERRSELASEAKEAQRQEAYARQASAREKAKEAEEATEAARWEIISTVLAGLGVFTLLLVLVRFYRNNCRSRRQGSFAEPLI